MNVQHEPEKLTYPSLHISVERSPRNDSARLVVLVDHERGEAQITTQWYSYGVIKRVEGRSAMYREAMMEALAEADRLSNR